MSSDQHKLANLSPDRFQIRFDNLPNIHFRLTAAPIPGMSIVAPKVGTTAPQKLQMLGNNVEFSPMNITFVVDENMDNWLEVLRWIKRTVESDDLEEDGILANASIVVLDSDLKEVVQCHLRDCVPNALSDIFLSVNDDSPQVVSTLTLEYSTFKIQGINFETEYL